MRTDSLDVSSLVSYINDIKPFHSKLTTVVVEYQANDNVYATITDKSQMAMQFSSAWELQLVSDGKRTQYRIPATVFPRYADDFHQCKRIGVTDEVPGVPGAYFVPYNNGVEVFVNGLKRTNGFDYVLDDARTVVQFKNNPPKLGDEVCLNWAVVDRIFLRINDNDWVYHELEYSSVADGMEMFPYDASKFDSSSNPVLTRVETDVKLESIGRVRVISDSTGKPYYVFEFYKPQPLDTKIWIRVEQREAYNGWTQTKFTETVFFKDVFRFKDTVNAQIVDPGTWQVNPDLFGIDISPIRVGNFDIEGFDVMDYDSLNQAKMIGYYTTFNIRERLADTFNAKFTDSYRDRLGLIHIDSVKAKTSEAFKSTIKQASKDNVQAWISDLDPGLYDEAAFDTVALDSINSTLLSLKQTASGPSSIKTKTAISEIVSFKIILSDGTSVENDVYKPDDKGLVEMTKEANRVEIQHNYGYNPLVAVYFDGKMMIPASIVYPSEHQVLVTFSKPRKAVIRIM